MTWAQVVHSLRLLVTERNEEEFLARTLKSP